MKYRQRKAREKIEVGDVIAIENCFGRKSHPVVRVTKTAAFIRWNDGAEGKFRRVLVWNSPTPIPRQQWDYTHREVYAPIGEK